MEIGKIIRVEIAMALMWLAAAILPEPMRTKLRNIYRMSMDMGREELKRQEAQ
jgi:hypothetical protein